LASSQDRRRLWDEEEDPYALFEAMTFLAFQAIAELTKVAPGGRSEAEWLQSMTVENALSAEVLWGLLGDDYDA
jgi:hypothetical protein